MIDHLEVSRLELADFGELVTVTPPLGVAFPVTMIFDDGVEDARLGALSGHVGTPAFRCLPEDAGEIVEEALLTRADGSEYRVFEPIPVAGCLTEIRVNEQ